MIMGLTSEIFEERIEQLEKEKQVAEELLFLVLDHVDEPVTLNVEEAKQRIKKDRRIDLDFNDEAGTWTLQVVTIEDEL